MNKKDIRYRQGRSKKQVESNNKLAMLSFGVLFITILVTAIYNVIFG